VADQQEATTVHTDARRPHPSSLLVDTPEQETDRERPLPRDHGPAPGPAGRRRPPSVPDHRQRTASAPRPRRLTCAISSTERVTQRAAHRPTTAIEHVGFLRADAVVADPHRLAHAAQKGRRRPARTRADARTRSHRHPLRLKSRHSDPTCPPAPRGNPPDAANQATDLSRVRKRTCVPAAVGLQPLQKSSTTELHVVHRLNIRPIYFRRRNANP
jgi:hypothetical protein